MKSISENLAFANLRHIAILHRVFPLVMLVVVLSSVPMVAVGEITTGHAESSVTTDRRADGDRRSAPWSDHEVGESVAVTTATGRVVRGRIDPRTSNRLLWVSVSIEGMTIGSRHPVSEVLRVEPAAPLSLPPIGSTSQNGSTVPTAAKSNGDAVPKRDENVTQIRGETPNRFDASPSAPTSLAAAARLENWNGDPDPDGLRLVLFPRDRAGNVVTAAGSVTISLQVYRGEWRDVSGRMRTEESWTREVRAADYSVQYGGEPGVVVDLPFRRIRPETDAELIPVGTLKVRFRVPGRGTLDTSIDDVELRPYSFTRELRRRG